MQRQMGRASLGGKVGISDFAPISATLLNFASFLCPVVFVGKAARPKANPCRLGPTGAMQVFRILRRKAP
jgi:hypothetical protein